MKLLSRALVYGLSALVIVASVFFSSSGAQATVTPSSGPTSGGTTITVQGISFVSVHTGENYALGLTSEGTLYSWGANQSGQLGNGTTTTSTTPQPVLGEGGVGILRGVTQVSAGTYHVIAVTPEGVFAWGDNQFGQLGIGTTSNQANPFPSKVVGLNGNGYLSGVTQIVASGFHSMAIVDGSVYSWGSNSWGQLGDNTVIDKNVPTRVLGESGTGYLTGITSIASRGAHSLASSGTALYAWGANAFGQLGVGTTTSSSVPLRVLGPNGNGFLTGIEQISTGNTHSLALVSGNVYSWGWNVEGMLGTGSTTDSSVPTLVLNESGTAPLAGVESIGTGSYNSYAAIAGKLYVWGSNTDGTLCIGSSANQVPFATLPVWVLGESGSSPLENILDYSAGNRVTSVLTPSGIMTCGDNHNGQFGNGNVVNSTRVVLGPHFVQTGFTIGQNLAENLLISGDILTGTTAPSAAGVVNVTGTANVFGGTTAATPATVSWNAGTFTYEAALANTGSADLFPFGLASAGAILLGAGLLLALRRQQNR